MAAAPAGIWRNGATTGDGGASAVSQYRAGITAGEGGRPAFRTRAAVRGMVHPRVPGTTIASARRDSGAGMSGSAIRPPRAAENALRVPTGTDLVEWYFEQGW